MPGRQIVGAIIKAVIGLAIIAGCYYSYDFHVMIVIVGLFVLVNFLLLKLAVDDQSNQASMDRWLKYTFAYRAVRWLWRAIG